MKKSSLLLLCGAFFVIAVALFYAWTNWSGARELEAALAQLAEKKESIRMEDFIPPPVRDDQNVAKALIFQEFFTSGEESRLGKFALSVKNLCELFAGERSLIQKAKKFDPAFSGDEAAAGRVVLEYLSPSAPIVEEVREALRRPQVNWPLDYSKAFINDAVHVNPVQSVSHMLGERALAELAAGFPDKAFQDTMMLLALAGATGSPGTIVCYAVQNVILSGASRVINDGLSRGVWSDKELAAFSVSLTHQDKMRQFVDCLRMERAMSQQGGSFNPKYLAFPNGDWGTRRTWTKTFKNIVLQTRPVGWVKRDRALHLLRMQRLIEALGDGNCVSPTEVRNISSPSASVSKWDRSTTPVSYLLLSGMPSSVESVCFRQTLLESTRAACAVERYRLANKRLPEQLNDLVPAFLPEVPKDPLTGAPLFYKPSPEGSFVIYGVGSNQTDDGGSVHSPQSENPRMQADWGVFVSRG